MIANQDLSAEETRVNLAEALTLFFEVADNEEAAGVAPELRLTGVP